MKLSVWIGWMTITWMAGFALGSDRPVAELKQPQMPLGFIPLSEKEQAFHVWTPQTLFTFDREGLTWCHAKGHEMRQVFVQALKGVVPQGLDPTKTKVNRYRNPQTWQQGMPMYRRLLYSDVYPGIDVIYKSVGGVLKRDIVVKPGADPSQIRIAFEGIQGLSLQAGGKLVIETTAGNLEEAQPYVYQEKDGARHSVAGHFVRDEKHQIGFAIGAYDPSLPLVIDPVISSGTYGGSGSDAILAGYATDTAYYFTGQTTSTDLPLMNPIQATNAGGTPDVGDAFLACFDKTTMQLTYATYFGGSGSDQANGIFVDSPGNATIAGWTDSSDLAVLNAVQSTHGGLTDGFLAQFDASGALVWATYHGGSGDDQIADLDGNDFFEYLNVVGFTTSADFPLMNADDMTCGCSNGAADASFARYKFDGSLNTSTYLGGNVATTVFSDQEAGTALANDVALDVFALGETAYVTGWTQSTDFPKQPFSGDHAGGRDAFYVLYGFDGRRDYAILLGGSGDDVGDGIAAFNQSEVVITGSTSSSVDFPVTANAQQSAYGGGASDAFIARINGSNSPIRRTVTYWGGSGMDAGREIYFGRDNALFLNRYLFAGVTDSPDFPLDSGGTTAGSEGLDSFILVGEKQGTQAFDVFEGELIGGPGSDGIFSLSGDPSTGPFAVLAAGTTNDPGGLPRLGPFRGSASNVGSGTGPKGVPQNQDDGFFSSFCTGPCIGPQQFDLKVTMTLESSEGGPVSIVASGQFYRYRVKIENIGLADAPADASVFITIPNAKVLITVGQAGTCTETQNSDDAIVDCVIDPVFPIAPGDSRTLFVAFQAFTPEIAVIENRIRASALVLPQVTDLDPTNNIAFADRVIQAELLGGAGGNVTQGNSEDEGDPISTSNGAFHFEKPLLNLGGPMPLSASLIYRSDLPSLVDNINPRRFWFRPFATLIPELPINGNSFTTAQLPNGDIISFVQNGADWDLVQGDVDLGFGTATGNTVTTLYQLVQDGAWFYVADPRFGKIYLFENVGGLGLIRAMMDRNSNTHRYIYGNGDGNPPTRAEDGLGRSFDFEYLSIAGSLNVYLSKITDQGGRQIQFAYEAVGADNAGMVTLRSVTDSMSQTTSFAYAGPDLPGHRITQVIRPDGQANLQQEYAYQELDGFQEQRVTTQTHVVTPKASGGAPTASLSYDDSMNRVSYTNELGKVWEYQSTDHHGQNASITDPALNQIQFNFDPDGLLDQVTDRDNRTMGMTFHKDSGLPMTLTDATGGIFQLTLTPNLQAFTNPISGGSFSVSFYDVTRVDLPDGTFATRTLDGKGNQTQLTLPTGEDYDFTYNQRGQMLTTENPAGGLQTQTYDANGNLASRTDSETGLTVYTYDSLFRNTKITLPSGEESIFAWNQNSRLTQFTDLRGNQTTMGYDALDNLRSITGPDGEVTSFTYNRFDILLSQTDALNRKREFGVNMGNQITSFNDGSGDLVHFTYNDAGFRSSVRRGGVGFDEIREGEGNLVEKTSSNGMNTAIAGREARGLIDQITTPQGRRFQFSYDAASRMVSRTLPSGRKTNLIYDANGHLTRIQYPGGIETGITRNSMGLGTHYLDAAGNSWDFTYTTMGREESRSDPLGRQTLFEYDASGRLSRTTLPGTTIDYTHDGSLITGMDFSASGPRQTKAAMSLSFGYDSRGNLTAAENIGLTYDLANQLTSWTRNGTTFSQTFDAAGRLETLTYPGGAMVVTYRYDDRGHLVQISDDLTSTQLDITYDDLGRPAGISRSNQVDTTFTYQPDGFLAGIQESMDGGSPFIDLQYRFDIDGNQVGETMVAPLLPEQQIAVTNQTKTFDAASQITEPGYLYDDQGRLIQDPVHGTWTWDMASRLVGFGGVILAYDGLGHITQMDDGEVTDLHTHPSMGRSHVLMEQSQVTVGSGARWRFYVFTPDGKLLYGVDRQTGDTPFFYHFDRRGSTLAVSDSQGQVVQAYAYSPFGQVVGSQQMRGGPGNDQLYTHAGKDGVLALPGGVDLMGSRPFVSETGTFANGMVDFQMLDRGTANPGELGPYSFGWNRPLDVTQSDGNNWGQPDFGTTGETVLDAAGDPNINEGFGGIIIAPTPIDNRLDGNDPLGAHFDIPGALETTDSRNRQPIPKLGNLILNPGSSIYLHVNDLSDPLEIKLKRSGGENLTVIALDLFANAPDILGSNQAGLKTSFGRGLIRGGPKTAPRTASQITERSLARQDPSELTPAEELDIALAIGRTLVNVLRVAKTLNPFRN